MALDVLRGTLIAVSGGDAHLQRRDKLEFAYANRNCNAKRGESPAHCAARALGVAEDYIGRFRVTLLFALVVRARLQVRNRRSYAMCKGNPGAM